MSSSAVISVTIRGEEKGEQVNGGRRGEKKRQVGGSGQHPPILNNDCYTKTNLCLNLLWKRPTCFAALQLFNSKDRKIQSLIREFDPRIVH